jgi:hypothetical protein
VDGQVMTARAIESELVDRSSARSRGIGCRVSRIILFSGAVVTTLAMGAPASGWPMCGT